MRPIMRALLAAGVFAALPASLDVARAQDYPTKPIRVVTEFVAEYAETDLP